MKGSRFTYAAKKLMSFVVLAKQGVKVNWSTIIFNNLYSKLWNLSPPTKPSANKDIIKFEIAQVVDIMFQNWVLVDSTLILLESNEEDEGATKLI